MGEVRYRFTQLVTPMRSLSPFLLCQVEAPRSASSKQQASKLASKQASTQPKKPSSKQQAHMMWDRYQTSGWFVF